MGETGVEERWRQGTKREEGVSWKRSSEWGGRKYSRNGDIEYCSVVKLLVHPVWRAGILRGGFEEKNGGRNGRMMWGGMEGEWFLKAVF